MVSSDKFIPRQPSASAPTPATPAPTVPPQAPQTEPPASTPTSETPQPAASEPAAEAPQATRRPRQPSASEGTRKMPLRSPAEIDLKRFNELVGDWRGKPVEDLKRLFVKQVILDDQTTIDVETVKVPGFIGIADGLQVTNFQGKTVSGHEDIATFLDRDGLYICTYLWHKERYGTPIDTRRPLDKQLFLEAFMKNEGHHSGAVVPAQRRDSSSNLVNSYASFNEPNEYHRGLYGDEGYVAAAQRLVFPEFVTAKQARGYTDTIICWMALLNPFVKFPSDYNGGDPTHISDRAKLKEFLKNALLAALGDAQAIKFFDDPLNMCYCAEFMFVSLNTPVYPFNKKGLTELLGSASKAEQILAMQAQQNQRQTNALSKASTNPEFKALNIPMPIVPDNLPPLDDLMAKNGQTIDPNSLPFPPFKISQVIRRAFRTLLPRQQSGDSTKLAKAQARMFKFMEPALMQQMGLENAPSSDPAVLAVHQFVETVSQQLDQPFASYDAFDQAMDLMMQQADEMLVGVGDRMYFVPPRIYVDLGQNDGDSNLPQGWGFRLETVGALIARSVIGAN